jgi:hypothetical protein
MEPGGIVLQAPVTIRLQQLGHRFANSVETIDHQPHLLLPNPLGVITLMHHGAPIAFDNDGQIHGQRFADAPRTRLADEEIRQAHEVGNFPREAFHMHGNVRVHRAEGIERGLVPPAQHDELYARARPVQSANDANCVGGPDASK